MNVNENNIVINQEILAIDYIIRLTEYIFSYQHVKHNFVLVIKVK